MVHFKIDYMYVNISSYILHEFINKTYHTSITAIQYFVEINARNIIRAFIQIITRIIIYTFSYVSLLFRLPVIQGSNGAFIAPIIAMMNTEQFTCVISNEGLRGVHSDMGMG